MICRPAFNYARDTHTVQLLERGAVFQNADVSLGLFSSVPLEEDGRQGVTSTFTLQQDHWAYFLLESAGDQETEPPHLSHAQYQKILLDTKTIGAPGSRSVATRAAGARWCSGQPWP